MSAPPSPPSQRRPSEPTDRQPAAPPPAGAAGPGASPPPPHSERRRSRFRFKSRSQAKRDRDRNRDAADGSPSRRHRRHRHRHRRRSASPDAGTSGPPGPPPLSPGAAFRESLFDALADDEGAAYWEGVYGQPVHVYGGALERMTDDEYAAHVRASMWERTHTAEREERERARRRRRRAAEEAEAAEEADRAVAAEVEASLRRGRERRRRREWRDRWAAYVAAWAAWRGESAGVPWPTPRGSREEVAEDGAVREFFVRGLGLEELGAEGFAARLREERVRWHPDKVQQRLGGRADEGVLRDVTAIFQVVDRLWSDTRRG